MTVRAYMKRPVSSVELDKLRDMAHTILSMVQEIESRPAVPSIEDDGTTNKETGNEETN